jgi:predicted metal-dependent hydrolase
MQAHAIELAGARIAYRLHRSRRRSIGLRIDRQGLRVGAPLDAPLAEIEAVLLRHAAWVRDKLARWCPEGAAVPLADGAVFPLLGEPCVLSLPPGLRRSRWSGTRLELAVPAGGEVAVALGRALRQKARTLFAERLVCLAERLGVPTPPLFLSSAVSRWGSCNAKGEIRLAWRLVHCPPALIDYVVAHELAHLKEMNHGPRFWSWVERLHPEWRAARAELRTLAPSLPHFP